MHGGRSFSKIEEAVLIKTSRCSNAPIMAILKQAENGGKILKRSGREREAQKPEA
jgi:hypothetical protein